MWGHYADSHKGVCLVFDIPAFFYEKCDEKEHLNLAARALFPVIYQNEKPKPKSIYNNVNENYQRVIRDAISHKGSEWEFEHEVRLIVATWNATPDKHTDIVWKDGCPHYNGLMGYLRGVIIGVKCETITSWVECRLRELKYDGVVVARATESPTHYRIEVKGEAGVDIFRDSDDDVINRDFKQQENGQSHDSTWFMLPKIAKVLRE